MFHASHACITTSYSASNSCRKNRLAESDPCQDLRENLIITKKYVLKMSVPTEIGAQMLSFL